MSKTIRHFSFALVVAALLNGCSAQDRKDKDFFTSGSREADQRAEQRMAKTEQLRGQSTGTDKAKNALPGNEKKPLYDRLGGDKGVAAIVDDFVPRVLADPRVNFDRKGVTRGGMSIHRNESVQWNASEDNVNQFQKHLVQFIAVATGGPPTYDG